MDSSILAKDLQCTATLPINRQDITRTNSINPILVTKMRPIAVEVIVVITSMVQTDGHPVLVVGVEEAQHNFRIFRGLQLLVLAVDARQQKQRVQHQLHLLHRQLNLWLQMLTIIHSALQKICAWKTKVRRRIKFQRRPQNRLQPLRHKQSQASVSP